MGTWLNSCYSIGGTIAFMTCGANSDLFGRRTFIMFGNILVLLGSIVGATSHHIGQSIAAHVLLGFGGGNSQIAAFALPELLPNKWRHWAVVMADAGIYFDVIVGPVAARIAYANTSVSKTMDPTKCITLLTAHAVALGLLGHYDCSRHLDGCSRTFLLSPKAPERYSLASVNQRARLCRHGLFHWCRCYDSIRNCLRWLPSFKLPTSNWSTRSRFCLPGFLRIVGNICNSQAPTRANSPLYCQQRPSTYRSVHRYICCRE